MSTNNLHVNLFDLLAPLAKTVDLMSSEVADHHLMVAYLAMRIGEEMGYGPEARRELVLAGSLHDIGAFSIKDRLDLLAFEDDFPTRHSMAGYYLVRTFPPFESIAKIIRFHHEPWRDGKGAEKDGLPVPCLSHLIHLADRIAVLVPKRGNVLARVGEIVHRVRGQWGSVFVPEYVDAFFKIAGRDYLWLEAASENLESIIRQNIDAHTMEIGMDDLYLFSQLICRVIDFRSKFTATHSSGVTTVAVALGKMMGFSEKERRLLQIAACLHDLGKLAIPSEILEKPGALTEDERFVMRTHVYHTFRILNPVEPLATVSSWGALHQERLDGSGYPFGHTAEELPLGARIMAVADVFTALTEDRPYRPGMAKTKAVYELSSMAGLNELDEQIVGKLLEHFNEINEARADAQQLASREYESFQAALG
jgi:HD-GYP domain-containing protein (c-di-GMP phosphodiesterase class II)